MLDNAIKQQPDEFKNFDRTKNVQDQLQDMITINGLPEYYQKLKNIWVYALSQSSNWMNNNFSTINSMEQLWLAFVMKEKYVKIWDGIDWINNITE